MNIREISVEHLRSLVDRSKSKTLETEIRQIKVKMLRSAGAGMLCVVHLCVNDPGEIKLRLLEELPELVLSEDMQIGRQIKISWARPKPTE